MQNPISRALKFSRPSRSASGNSRRSIWHAQRKTSENEALYYAKWVRDSLLFDKAFTSDVIIWDSYRGGRQNHWLISPNENWIAVAKDCFIFELCLSFFVAYIALSIQSNRASENRINRRKLPPTIPSFNFCFSHPSFEKFCSKRECEWQTKNARNKSKRLFEKWKSSGKRQCFSADLNSSRVIMWRC